MQQQNIPSLPLYPEERHTTRPIAERVLRLYSHTQRHIITSNHGDDLHAYEPELNALQEQVLNLLRVPLTAYRPANQPQN